MTTTSIGRQAEETAAEWLASRGYQIIDRNWRTRWCEIDIIAQKNKILYFAEVRYRKQDNWGDGLDSITPKKYQQMEFAAQLWLGNHNWSGDARLCVLSVCGQPPQVSAFTDV